MGTACRSRKLLLVGDHPDQYLCMADVNARVGDWICILFGGDVPFVLRKQEQSPSQIKPNGEDVWQLIGECYVDGIMDGEALRKVYPDSLETFVLV